MKWVNLVELVSVHFLDIWTSKNGLNSLVFLDFWLGNVLRATTACTFSTSERQKVVWSRCVLYTFDLEMCFAPQRRALSSTSERQKVVWSRCVLYILSWKCASRNNGVHFFDTQLPKVVRRCCVFFFTFWLGNVLRATTACTFLTSQSGLRMVCFVHFDLEMCFAPQRRALLRHRNF